MVTKKTGKVEKIESGILLDMLYQTLQRGDAMSTRMLTLMVLMLISGSVCPAIAQDTVREAPDLLPESYRLRIENIQYGRIEVTTDRGFTYHLIGRVLRAAEKPAPNSRSDERGVVLAVNEQGILFAPSISSTLKILPVNISKALKQDKSALLTDIPSSHVLFNDFAPPKNSPVGLDVGQGRMREFYLNYFPSFTDTFLLMVNTPPLEGMVARFHDAAQQYEDGAVHRARANNRKVVSGLLTLRAKLPQGEPDPIHAVTYHLDGEILAAQNGVPPIYVFDTRKFRDGEHVIEIRALNKAAGIISRVRALVVFNNKKQDKAR